VSDGKGMHTELRDDLAAYALGALGERESASVAEHLVECDACRDYVLWLKPAVDVLPASVAQLEPPEGLRESIMATVRAEAQGAPAAPSATPAAGQPERDRRWRSWRGIALRPATGLAAVAVLAGGAVAGYELAGDDGATTRSTVQVQAEGRLAPDEVLGSVEHGAGGDAILHVDRAPALGPGRFYQAWVTRGDEMKRSASFRPDAGGSYDAALGDSLEGADSVLVTVESQRTPDAPSQALVMSASLG
jgi:anti-sigma factor RsiW